jgi:hypothetical protein
VVKIRDEFKDFHKLFADVSGVNPTERTEIIDII